MNPAQGTRSPVRHAEGLQLTPEAPRHRLPADQQVAHMGNAGWAPGVLRVGKGATRQRSQVNQGRDRLRRYRP